nr:heavy metal translocating P-type ATPase metal-binding domain-containing protein [Chitinophagaceae bacterium]
CIDSSIHINEKYFCCNGCNNVYLLLHQHQMEDYYCLNEVPGKKIELQHSNKFDFLNDEEIIQKIISFKNEKIIQVEFYLPQIHCSSCLWLLEHLYKINENINSSQVNFLDKKVKIQFNYNFISLKEVADLLTTIGYEPYISMQDYEGEEKNVSSRKNVVKLGIVGFCFANIMLISFPEYLGMEFLEFPKLTVFFRYTSLLLSLPVLAYGAKEFFVNAIKSLKQKVLNIDAPIALAILITFLRSVIEIFSNTGSGYLDSMSGIIFFMLIGRTIQSRTFKNLKFNRDFKSYFPIAVHVVKNGIEISKKIQEVEVKDVIKLYHQEIIPVDGILISRKTQIDYSFVTGESEISELNVGDLVFAGGKIMSSNVEIQTIKSFKQNTFTNLWNNEVFSKDKNDQIDFVEKVSKYFSMILLILAFSGFLFWQISGEQMLSWQVLTAVLIIACPCTLLLATSYTYGFLIERFSNMGFYVKNASVLSKLTNINHIVFDKTGTLTNSVSPDIILHELKKVSSENFDLLLSVMQNSSHPLSKMIVNNYKNYKKIKVENYKETSGMGIEAWFDDKYIKIGKQEFVLKSNHIESKHTTVFFKIDQEVEGFFEIKMELKSNVVNLLEKLNSFKLSLLSGDNAASEHQMKSIFPVGSKLYYNQSPSDKLEVINDLKKNNDTILMIGDGINDAGAIKQSDVGISIVSNQFSFSPASDAILDENSIQHLNEIIYITKQVKRFIISLFVYSLFYNIIGISISLSGNLKPVYAAILMPISSISVIMIAFFGVKYFFNKNLNNIKI